MDIRLKQLVEQAEQNQPVDCSAYTKQQWLTKFAELIIQECYTKNRELSHELSGVLADLEHGGAFDHECLATVMYVCDTLSDQDYFNEHFGLEK